jgi:transposase
MLSLPSSTRVVAAVEPVDMRKSFNGLHAVAAGQLGESPASGALFLFSNRRRDRLKILYWDGTGLWVLAKRLEKGRFSWPRSGSGSAKIALRAEAFAQLVCGVRLDALSLKPWYER